MLIVGAERYPTYRRRGREDQRLDRGGAGAGGVSEKDKTGKRRGPNGCGRRGGRVRAQKTTGVKVAFCTRVFATRYVARVMCTTDEKSDLKYMYCPSSDDDNVDNVQLPEKLTSSPTF